MREIKFRGLAGAVWRYGDYETYSFRKKVSQICTEDLSHFKVGDTAGQYTGIKDKNGVEIYEGDILRGHGNPDDLTQVAFGQFGVVNMEGLTITDNVVGWHTKVIPTDATSRAFPFCLDMPLTEHYVTHAEWEIVGNIYENPELLAVKGMKMNKSDVVPQVDGQSTAFDEMACRQCGRMKLLSPWKQLKG